MQTFKLLNDGQIVSNKSSSSRLLLVSFIIILFGVTVFANSLFVIFNREKYFDIQISKSYLGLPASIGVVIGGIIIGLPAYRRPQKVFLSKNEIRVANDFSFYSAKWHEIEDFVPDSIGVSVYANISKNSLDIRKEIVFRVPLVGNSASEFSEKLNAIKAEILSGSKDNILENGRICELASILEKQA